MRATRPLAPRDTGVHRKDRAVQLDGSSAKPCFLA